MKWFRFEEFACRCCRQLLFKENVTALVEAVLDPVREAYGRPIKVNSCYRCERHNEAVGGVAGSQHLRGEAADICCGQWQGLGMQEFKEENLKIARLIVANGQWDQLILYPSFLHVSWKRGGGNRKQILKKVGNGYVKIDKV